MEIYYFHGFRSNAESGEGKVATLEKTFPECKVIPLAYQPHKPKQTKRLLDELFSKGGSCLDEAFIIGTSLGGFWALYTSMKYGVDSSIINPSMSPHKTMQVGEFINHKTGEYDIVTQDDIDEFEVTRKSIKPNFYSAYPCALIAMDDDVIDPNASIKELESLIHVIIRYPDGGHRFTRFSDDDVTQEIRRQAYTIAIC